MLGTMLSVECIMLSQNIPRPSHEEHGGSSIAQFIDGVTGERGRFLFFTRHGQPPRGKYEREVRMVRREGRVTKQPQRRSI